MTNKKIKPTISNENRINNAQENHQDMQKLSLQTITFSDSISTFDMKNKNTNNTILEQILNKSGSDIKLDKRDNVLSTNSAIVKLQPKRRTQSIGFVHKHYFNYHACTPPKMISDYININRWNEFHLNIKFKENLVFVEGFSLSINKYTLLVPMGSKTAMLILY